VPRPSFSVLPDQLNESALPLIDDNIEDSGEVAREKAKEDPSLHDISSFNREDLEELALAGPVQWLNCAIVETAEQREYRIANTTASLKGLVLGLLMAVGIYSFLIAVFIIGFSLSDSHGSAFLITLRGLCILSMSAIVFTLKDWYGHFSFPWAMTGVYVVTSLSAVLTVYTIDQKFVYIVVLEVMYTNVVVNHISSLPFGYIFIANICIVMSWLIVFFNAAVPFAVALESTFFLVAYMLINGAASFSREHQDRITYNLNKLSEREIHNTKKLLNQMMPAHVIKNLEEGVTTTDRYVDITMLFADIVGFTNWSSKKTPMEVVSMLNKLFKTFDHLCVKNSVYKVHTIGDCYVILGFTNKGVDLKRDPAQESTNMINMALNMIRAIKKINRNNNLDLNMRIGLHTGELIAGITGTNIVRYDIYGPDVDIANKMESGGQAGKINVSEVTMEKLEVYNAGRFDYVFNKVITHEPVNRALKSYFVIAHEDKE
jgi:class 3 adenylate cyclase